MPIMNRTIKAFCMVVLLAIVMTACAPQAAPAPAQPPVAPAAKAIKVALLLPGAVNDNGWDSIAYKGVMAGKDSTGAQIAYSENLTLPDYEASFRDYASKGYNLIIGHGSEFGDAATTVAKEFPNTYFAVTNSGVSGPNLTGLDTKNEEFGYMGGYIAGVMTKSKKVGMIAADQIVAFKRSMSGFPLGVKASCPDCQITQEWVGSESDAGKAKEIALAMIQQGVDIIYPDADAASLGAIDACKSQNVMVIGDTGDQTPLAPDQVVVNTMQDLTPMFVGIMKTVASGQFKPNTVQLNGYDTGIYYLSPFNTKLVSSDQQAKILAELAKLKAGQIKLPHLAS
jgi:basic membrane protein A and related proteins